jgi:hypothetical protein
VANNCKKRYGVIHSEQIFLKKTLTGGIERKEEKKKGAEQTEFAPGKISCQC